MKKLIPILTLISMLLQGCDQDENKPSDIVGQWKLVSLTIHGNPWSQAEGRQLVTTFSKDHTFQILVGDLIASRGTYSLNNSNLDMSFDVTTNSPKTTIKHILRVDCNTLTLCNLENGIRPDNFDGTTNSILQVLEKIE